jgi:hypothetical protein
VRVVIGAKLVATSFGDGLRSQIFFSPSLEKFRDPGSAIFLLKNYASAPQKLFAYSAQAEYFLFSLSEFMWVMIWTQFV